MKQLTRLQAVLAVVLLILGTSGMVRGDNGDKNGQNNEARLKTALSGAMMQGKTPNGSADFRSDARGRSRLNVEVESVNLPDGTILTVSIQHAGVVVNVGAMTLRAGHGELELNSQDATVVPAVQSGDVLTVSNGATAVLAGVF